MITFHKTSLKLASLYLAVIMAISLFFSATIYQVSVSELQRNLRRPLPAFEGGGLPSNFRERLLEERFEAYDEAHDKIVTKLIIINFGILVFGGCLSYYLALRTLKPIEDAHEAQRIFANSASHELRTPITAMRSENEVALMDPNLTLIGAKQQLKSNIEELEKLTNLSEGLLRLAQAEGAHANKETMFVKDIVSEAVERLKSAAKKRSITITTGKFQKQSVYGNPTALTEILVVLLDNAIKYSPEQATVHILCEDQSSHVAIQIQDEGPGIPPEQIDHIFDRFYRADVSRTKQSVGGFGLGLAIASELAKAIDAELSVISTVGQGSVFTLTTPKTA